MYDSAHSLVLSHPWTIAATFPILWCLVQIGIILLDPLRDVPGPFWARFSRLWYLRAVSRGNFEQVNVDLHRRYGPIARIAPGQYSINNPAAVRTIYSHASNFVKAPWYHASGNPNPNASDLFTERDPLRHSTNRRKVASLYSMTSLVPMENSIAECTNVLIERLSEFAVSGRSFDLQHWMQCYAFDVIGLITVDKRFGFLDTGTDQNSLLASLHAYLVYAANVGVYSEWHGVLSRVLALFGSPGMAHLQSFTMEQILLGRKDMEIAERSDDRTDSFLRKLLKMNAKTPEKISMDDIFTACITNIGAGSDTTSISLTSLIYHLLKQPSSYAKLKEEIDEADRHGELSSPHITFQESQKLPYLQACIKEALRIHPATGLPLVRVVPPGGATICGRFFREGEIVGVNSWVIHRNPQVFGPDTDTFRPERWLENTTKASDMERNFLAFGAGARTCIGKNISLMEIGKLIPELLRRFDFELVNPEAKLETQNVWFVKQKNVWCQVRVQEPGSPN